MKEDGSFRDPDGYIFYLDQHPYRAITYSYKDNYDHLIKSGLYDKLVKEGYLVPHIEVENQKKSDPGIYLVIKPERIPFISYPYEWSFSQLKDAALLTLEIQKIAIEFGMILKDASAYNIQFLNGHPVLIDTLSFEAYIEHKPWEAYRQFCQHFLAPIALMGKLDVRLNCLLKDYIDGIPLDLCCKLLPARSFLNTGLLFHLYFHSAAQIRYNNSNIKVAESKRKFTRHSLIILIYSLIKTINNIKWKPPGTEWGDYYADGVHQPQYTALKKQIVAGYINTIKPDSLWDFGANTGIFSRIASDLGISVVAFDIDPACVESNYIKIKNQKEQNILPILFDLINPSPSIGWANLERKNLNLRGPVDTLMALALIHHLSISNNLPLQIIAEYFSMLSTWLIIEFIPKDDEKVLILLNNREDIFPDYTKENFENEFLDYYEMISKDENPVNNRILYLMRKK